MHKALSENKALAKGGLEHAKEVARTLEEKGIGKIKKEGSQFYFEINEEELRVKAEDLEISLEVNENEIEIMFISINS